MKKVIKSRPKPFPVSATEKKELEYEKDFFKWTRVQSSLLKKKQFDKIDLENIIEEIETLGRSDKHKLRNLFVVLLQHLLKNTYTPENKGNSKSCDSTIFNSRRGLEDLLDDSPSLKPLINKIFDHAYDDARQLALIETDNIYKDEIFPKKCPWKIEEILPFLNKRVDKSNRSSRSIP